MKKNYFNPNATFVEIEIDTVMNTVSGEKGGAGVGGGTAGNETPDISVEKRGEWGNLWY